VANWLTDHGNLPAETRDYVLTITRHPVEDWIGDAAAETITDRRNILKAILFTSDSRHSPLRTSLRCRLSALCALGRPARRQFFEDSGAGRLHPHRRSYSAIIGKIEPMVIGGRVPSRGFAPYYQVRAPAPSRAAADALCEKILRAGCAVSP